MLRQEGEPMNRAILSIVATATQLPLTAIEATLLLIEEGATIPFIARYRKEKTSNLDEEQIRLVVTTYERELNLLERKEEVIRLIAEKGKLTPELSQSIQQCTSLTCVDELYIPYREKKKTRATMAIDKGLLPLSQLLLTLPYDQVLGATGPYEDSTKLSQEEVLQGARDILAEQWSEENRIRQAVYLTFMINGQISSEVKKDAVDEKQTFANYYHAKEAVKTIPNHRLLAIDRGENENILKVKLVHPNDDWKIPLFNQFIKVPHPSSKEILFSTFEDSMDRLLHPAIERRIRNELSERAQGKAIELFAVNLEHLLLTPPLKTDFVLGIDPAFKTGCKLAVITGQGDFVVKSVIYPHEKYIGETVPEYRRKQADEELIRLLNQYHIRLIAIGNGTASRETEAYVANTLKKANLKIPYLIVSEAGASVYSASPLAKEEFPDLVVEERSAISIARRVIDPLSELIKIDPKSIGIGQYQYDVNQKQLQESLEFVISKVVNQVGVHVNSASVELLSYVSGLNKKTAQNIVTTRQQLGQFHNREELLTVKGMGPKTYEQAVGFLKILDSDNPLDKTFIHPASYPVVHTLLKELNLQINNIGSDQMIALLQGVNVKTWGQKLAIGEFTFSDILDQLKRPLRDIRSNYPTPLLRQDVLKMEDLKPGMQLEGTVRNLVDFGAFVDIGIKQAGLLHVSRMSKVRILHPSEVLHIGQIITVYVTEVSIEKERIGLSLFPQN